LSTDLKKKCAKEAMKYIRNNTIIGLGGGATIAYLIEYIKEEKDLNIKVVTPSFKTKMLCMEKGLEVVPTWYVDGISVAFDGCDEVDENLNAIKSGGGIHTKEKLIANMAKEYILLVDENKFVKSLTSKHPIVLEILKDSLKYVENKIIQLGGELSVRSTPVKDGFVITDNGNLLLDVKFNNLENPSELEKTLKNISGVIEVSLFTNIVSKVIVVSENEVKIIN